MRKRHFIVAGLSVLAITFFSVLTANALSTISAVDSSGVTQSNFTEGDTIYMQGQCSDAEDNEVDLYVTGNNSAWVDTLPLTDVRGAPQPVTSQDTQGNFGLTAVWPSATIGDYDLVIDVWRNGVYDAAVDCIDAAAGIGFTVDPAPAQTGSGTISFGSNDPGDHGWVIGEGDPNNVMLQLVLSADSTEDINVQSFSLSAGGSGDDQNAISAVKIYEDQNLWGSGSFPSDSGSTTISVSQTIPAGTSKTVIVVYEMGTAASFSDGDTFEVSVTDVAATGVTSGQTVNFSGLPKTSGTKTVTLPSAPAACSGNVTIDDKSDVRPSETISLNFDKISNCEGKTIKVYENACDQEFICECTLPAGANQGCSCTFTAPEIEGIYTLSACLDKNADGDYEDTGEEDSALLTVVAEAASQPPFQDTQGHWAEDYIKDLYDAGVVQGRSETQFEPNELITRAEVTKIAMLAFGHSVPESVTESPFPDVSTDAWFATYVSGAQDDGVIEGYPDGYFRPGQNINRVEVLKILIEAAGKDETTAPTANFPDTESDAWYAAYINYGIANSIVSGYVGGALDGLFGPANYATRAEVAKMTSILMSL